MLSRRVKGLSLACLLMLGTGVSWAQDLKTLVDQGNYQRAYDLAASQDWERAGEAEFDFYYGLSALETGQYQEAIFALERALFTVPQNHRTRLELARAFYFSGEFVRSTALFDEVLATEPPPRVRDNILYFKKMMTLKTTPATHQFSKSVTVAGGFDTNVNSGTTLALITIPKTSIDWVLDENSQEASANFLEFQLNLDYLYLLRKQTALFANAEWGETFNSDFDEFDMGSLSVGGGLLHRQGKHTWRFPLQYQMTFLDKHGYRNMTSLGMEWTKQASQFQQYALFGQMGGMRYPNDDERDADLFIFGGAWGYEFDTQPFSVLLSGYYGDETAQVAAGKHYGRSYMGLRASGTWVPKAKHEIELAFTTQSIEYAATHPSFLAVRQDDYMLISFSWDWQAQQDWQVSFVTDITTNQSNLGLYDYERFRPTVSFKHSF